MRTDRILTSTAVAAVAAVTLALPAQAQYAGDPYFDTTVEASQAFGLEMIGIRLRLAETFAPPFDEELVEQFEAMATSDWVRFGGTLAARDPALAEELREVLERIGEEAEDGEEIADLVPTARDLLARATEVVIAPELRASPAFTGAILLELLLAESGVAEGYEEAVEEVWEFPSGWAALQRVQGLWDGIESHASDERREDGQEMLATLHALYPDAGPPASVVGWNPEEAEAPAQRFGGIIEEVVDANLYPGRDLARLASHLSQVAATACTAYDAGDDSVADEGILAVFALYDAHLADTAGLFVPDGHQRVEEMFDALIELGDDDDDEEGEEGKDDDEEEDDLSSAEACEALSAALVEIRGALGG